MRPSTPLVVPPTDPRRTGGRALGIDLGERRIGVAVSDSDGRVATPIEVVTRSGDRGRDHVAIAALVTEWEVDIVVVGIPYSLDGSIGPAAKKMLAESNRLGDALPVPVETYDERFTTVTAERALMDQDMNARDRRQVVDKVAAAVMLQAWLDGSPQS
ncbi:MAG: Holliday junction resolvase RuvX [Acidimicrobiales bacterium]